METNKIYNENCLDTMAMMPDNFIDLVVTSPPYDNLRDYKGYSFPFEDIAKELFRVVKIGGVVVWVVKDGTIEGSETLTSFKQAIYFNQIGFKVHDTMIYNKNGINYPTPKKYYDTFEYMFVLAKGKLNTVNLIADRKNICHNKDKRKGTGTCRQADGTLLKRSDSFYNQIKEYGIRWNVWTYNTGLNLSSKDVTSFEHPATFPEQLAADHIYSWSNEGDLVFDPFAGSGTTLKMAHLQKRNWIGSEISEEYCKLAQKRIQPYLDQLTIF